MRFAARAVSTEASRNCDLKTREWRTCDLRARELRRPRTHKETTFAEETTIIDEDYWDDIEQLARSLGVQPRLLGRGGWRQPIGPHTCHDSGAPSASANLWPCVPE
mmetsp:Transcript_1213/g.3650  ORF Transcript_1213/g.3650 Transcript_1213/m.3650 type:complete len:106 (-) Transcript_1213:60-377(-)